MSKGATSVRVVASAVDVRMGRWEASMAVRNRDRGSSAISASLNVVSGGCEG